MDMSVEISVVSPQRDPVVAAEIAALLAEHDLRLDHRVEVFVTARRGGELVGCLGLDGNVVKCTAVAPSEQGTGISSQLMGEMHYIAHARGRDQLFVYTKPCNRRTFEGLGFTFLAEVPGIVVLLENSPFRLGRLTRKLHDDHFVDVPKVGAVVMNANPFTRGHQHLVKVAASECDVVHVLVVSEDAARFSAADRLALVRAGCAELPEADRINVIPGSSYVVSRATFPDYFLGDEADILKGVAGLDLQLFRNHIAPALGVTDRYVGTEPLSAITAEYNRELRHWLEDAPSGHPPIRVHEIERIGDGEPISASRVRALVDAGRVDEAAALVPAPTLQHLLNNTTTEGS